MSNAVKSKRDARKRNGLGSVIRSELSLIIGAVTATIFLWFGSRLLETLEHPGVMGVVFLWLFLAVLWSAISVVRHADRLAIKCGEPYGTLILTLSAITIEVMMISAAMLHGKNNPTLARDMMFAVIMIALNGLIGLSLLLGGLRHHEQHYTLQGASAYLNTIMALSVLGLVLPNFTTSMSGPRFSTVQEIFLAVTSIGLYAIFLLIQTMRHSDYFMDTREAGHSSEHHAGSVERYQCREKKPIAKVGKHSARISARIHWSDNSRGYNHWNDFEANCDSRYRRRQSTTASTYARSECSHV